MAGGASHAPSELLMDFQQRLRMAIERGHRRRDQQDREARERAMNEDELKRLHSQARLQLSEYIESCMRQVPQNFPGFQYETIYGERGWGAACSRDDLRIERGGRRENDFSRLELTIRPFSSVHVVDLAGKATIRNKELFIRSYFEPILDVDTAKFQDLVDAWIVEFAEQYAAKSS
jgi:hypothetical protein